MHAIVEDPWPCPLSPTPVSTLRSLHPGPGALVVKLENVHPSGSIKERTAAWMLGSAKRRGELPSGRPVLAVTSGNFGVALARRCHDGGHPFRAVVSAGTSPQKIAAIEAFGGAVDLVPQVDGRPGKITGRDLLAASRHARRTTAADVLQLAQLTDPAAVAVHTYTTAPEILRDVPGVDAFVASVGSAGTFIGVARGLPGVRCFAVEPATSRPLAGGDVRGRHSIAGTGFGIVPPHWDPTCCAGLHAVDDDEITAMMQACREKEGLLIGPSSAANIIVARRLLRAGEAATVVTLICDAPRPLS